MLNRYRVVKPYRGFESLRLRHGQFSTFSARRPFRSWQLPLMVAVSVGAKAGTSAFSRCSQHRLLLLDLSRRRNPEAREECRYIHSGDTRIGTIAMKIGEPLMINGARLPASHRDHTARTMAADSEARERHLCKVHASRLGSVRVTRCSRCEGRGCVLRKLPWALIGRFKSAISDTKQRDCARPVKPGLTDGRQEIQ